MSGINGFDLPDLRLRVERAREVSHCIGPRVFGLRYPTKLERKRLIGLARDSEGRLDEVRAHRNLVQASVLSWQGVTLADAYPEHKQGGEPLPFDADTLGLVFEEHPEWIDEMLIVLVSAWSAREKALEAAAKNSEAASSGSATAPDAASSQPSDSAA